MTTAVEPQLPAPAAHPRLLGWYGTTAIAMGGSNQSLFLIGALFIGQGDILGQGSAAVPLLIAGLLLAWAAAPGWTELILMYPNRVGGIAASCVEAFRPYSAVLANLTGVCYWWGWVPTCGLTAILSASALHQWYMPQVPVPLLASLLVLGFMVLNLCGIKWVGRLATPVATASAVLAFASGLIPVLNDAVDWHQATHFELTVPFPGWFGQLTSLMAGLYLVGFAAPAFEAASCHVGETVDPNRNVPKAMLASGVLAGLAAEEVERGIADGLSVLLGAMGWMALALAAIAVLDAPYQLWSYARKLRMSRQEVRDEAKQSEGRPEVKAKVRQLQMQMSRRRMMEKIPGADVVVTNPTHYAVALKYDGKGMRAPRVVAKGAGEVAAVIRELAREHRVPLVSAPPLARALYRAVDLEKEIPGDLYAAVAQVLTYVYQLKAWRGGSRPPQAPDIGPVPGGEPDPE